MVQLIGVSGWSIALACGLAALGGAFFPIPGQGLNENIATGIAVVLLVLGTALTLRQAWEPEEQADDAIVAAPSSTISVSPQPLTSEPLQARVDEAWDYMLDGSVAYEEAVDVIPSAQAVEFPPGGVKIGGSKLKLTLYNPNGETATVVDMRAADITTEPPVNGSLFHATAQGNASDQLALDLKEKRPVLREISRSGQVGDPFFEYSHIDVEPHERAVLDLTILPGPQAYRWHLEVTYQVGEEERTQKVDEPAELFRITGYPSEPFRQVYEFDVGWEERDPATFCRDSHWCRNLGSDH